MERVLLKNTLYIMYGVYTLLMYYHAHAYVTNFRPANVFDIISNVSGVNY